MPGLRLPHRVAVITGGGSGIGRECALLFASEGANVVLADINLEACQKTAGMVNERFNNAELPVKAVAMKCDVSKEDEVAAIVQRAVDEFGRLDVMVSRIPKPFVSAFCPAKDKR